LKQFFVNVEVHEGSFNHAEVKIVGDNILFRFLRHLLSWCFQRVFFVSITALPSEITHCRHWYALITSCYFASTTNGYNQTFSPLLLA